LTFNPPFDFSPFEENEKRRGSHTMNQLSNSQFDRDSNINNHSHQAIFQPFENHESLISLLWDKFH
jgi:hypothetical protein